MTTRTAALNVVGLTRRLIGEHTPTLTAFVRGGRLARIAPILPAVTCSTQSTYLTGRMPAEHGVVGNGWYDRESAEVRFWKQSNRLVQGEKIWDVARQRDPSFTCANLFWWYNMYSTVDIAVTPRPMYPADGRKVPDIHTHPGELRPWLQQRFGQFPLFSFWGPATSIVATDWIASAAIAIEERNAPTLSLVYLPHLDYVLQRDGPDPAHPAVIASLREIDDVCRRLIEYYESRGVQVVVLSEYGITPVTRPVHLNRLFRDAGWLVIRQELGREVVDVGASRVFAVADHQVAHIYVNETALLPVVRAFVAQVAGVERVLDRAAQAAAGLDHARAGDLVAVADADAWFTYYYWHDDRVAPDFARTVDIHRKPGYDPVELFLDPAIRFPRVRIGRRLLWRKLGGRALMDVIPLDASLVRGSHGRAAVAPDDEPVFITRQTALIDGDLLQPTAVRDLLLAHLGLASPEGTAHHDHASRIAAGRAGG